MQDSKDSKETDEKGKTVQPTAEQEEKLAPIPSAYDEDLILRAAMYGVLFQAYADKVSYWLVFCAVINLGNSYSLACEKLSVSRISYLKLNEPLYQKLFV